MFRIVFFSLDGETSFTISTGWPHVEYIFRGKDNIYRMMMWECDGEGWSSEPAVYIDNTGTAHSGHYYICRM